MKMMRIAVVTGALLVVAGCTPLRGRSGYPIRWAPAPAVLGGYGMGYGPYGPWMAHGRYGFSSIDLSPEQREKISAIEHDLRARQLPLMSQMDDLVWAGDEPFDEPGDRRDYEQFTALQKKVFENALDARRQVSAVLTQQQRDQLRRDWHDQR